MFERLKQREAQRANRSSHIGIFVASAALLVAGPAATAQFSSDFESPLYVGSAAGTIITGQDGFYIPVEGSQDGLVYTYAGNALSLPQNPTGGKQFEAGTGDAAQDVPFVRAQRDVVYGDGTGVWTVSFDIATTFVGELPSAQNIGSFSTQVFTGEATYISLVTWTDPETAANWNADYVWFDAQGNQLTESVADLGFQGLLIDHWYRWSTTFNLGTNQILQVSITDLTTNVTTTNSPLGRYLFGGAGGAPAPTGFRLFAGSGAVSGNTLAFDNIDIDLRPGPPTGACCLLDDSCVVLTEAACAAADGTYSGDGMGCTPITCVDVPPACNEDAGPCGEPNGTPGCEDPECCVEVCNIDPICCILDWDQQCANIAINVGCAPGPGQPIDLATGSDPKVDGYLRIGTDGYGSWADPGYGGGLGDTFNPVGAEVAGSPTFAGTFFVFRQAAGEGEILSTNSAYQDLCGDSTMSSNITTSGEGVDTNGNGVADTRVSAFDLTSDSGMDTSWQVTQHVFNDTPKGGPMVAIVEFEFLITNNGPPVDFILHRHIDIDSLYVTNSFADDNVGTGTNAAKSGSFVYQGELGFPETHITLSSPSGDVYYGAKGGFNPDPDDPNCQAPLAGTTDQVCANPDGPGTPECWKNFIPGIGYDTDGDSGPDNGGDGSIGLEIPVSLAAEGVTTVTVMLTYGAKTPGGAGGGPKCPWDLDNGGFVGAGDLLLLLADWGNPYGAADLLDLLAAWGACP